MKKKQFYEKPSMKVFKLKQQPQLLAGSNGVPDGLDPFTPGGDPLDPNP